MVKFYEDSGFGRSNFGNSRKRWIFDWKDVKNMCGVDKIWIRKNLKIYWNGIILCYLIF